MPKIIEIRIHPLGATKEFTEDEMVALGEEIKDIIYDGVTDALDVTYEIKDES